MRFIRNAIEGYNLTQTVRDRKQLGARFEARHSF
jgi:hypothetical protein